MSIKITGIINQPVDRFFTIYDTELSEWMLNTNRIPMKHMFLMRAEGLEVSLHLTDFRLSNDGFLHLEGNLVLPEIWKNKFEFTGFYYDKDADGVWAMLYKILDDAVNYANTGA